MSGRSFKAPEYPGCVQFKKKRPYFPITKEVLHQITLDTEILPLYEQKMDDYQHFRHGSLLTNEMLHCRWREYLSKIFTLKRQPFAFPLNSDLHFHNNLVYYRPHDTITNKSDIRRHYFQGPRYDHLGQIPLVHDLRFRQADKPVTPMAKKESFKKKKQDINNHKIGRLSDNPHPMKHLKPNPS